MLCCICKESEATVHLTQIAGEHVQTRDFCEACARKEGVIEPSGFGQADAAGFLPPTDKRHQPGRRAGL